MNKIKKKNNKQIMNKKKMKKVNNLLIKRVRTRKTIKE